MKKAILAVLMLTLIIGTAGLVQAQENENLHIGWVEFSLEVRYFQEVAKGARNAADDLGVDITVLDPRADSQEQVRQAEDLISKGVDALVLDPIESNSLVGVVDQAADKGIPVVTIDTDVDHPGVVSTIATSNFERSKEFGRYVAGYIHSKYDGEAKVGLMIASTEVQLQRVDGFKEALDAVPGAEIVDTGDGRNIYERSLSEAEDMLAANPDIDVIYATSDPALMGTIAAAEQRGVAQDIDFFGWDQVPDHYIPPLESGKLTAFINQQPRGKGVKGMELAVKAAKGEEVPRNIKTGIKIVTKFNVDQYK